MFLQIELFCALFDEYEYEYYYEYGYEYERSSRRRYLTFVATTDFRICEFLDCSFFEILNFIIVGFLVFEIFPKKCQFSEGRLPPEDVSVWLENSWTCFSDDIAKKVFPGFFWTRWDFSKNISISERSFTPEDVSVWLENL